MTLETEELYRFFATQLYSDIYVSHMCGHIYERTHVHTCEKYMSLYAHLYIHPYYLVQSLMC